MFGREKETKIHIPVTWKFILSFNPSAYRGKEKIQGQKRNFMHIHQFNTENWWDFPVSGSDPQTNGSKFTHWTAMIDRGGRIDKEREIWKMKE